MGSSLLITALESPLESPPVPALVLLAPLASPLGLLLEPPRVLASELLLASALPSLQLPFSALPGPVSALESSPVPALELPLHSALESLLLVPALASLLELLLELLRVSASELLVPALAPPLESLLELPRVSASELLLVSVL